MGLLEEYHHLIQELHSVANPIIQYKIDKDWYGNHLVDLSNYISIKEKPIDYWLTIYNEDKTHGREDCTFENSIAKLLDYGLTIKISEFDELFRHLLKDHYWQEDQSFEGHLMQTVRYPFLIRAGYDTNETIIAFFLKRLEMIEKTIEKYGTDFFEYKKEKYVFKFNHQIESLPTIYDLYAFAFLPKDNPAITRRIEKIIHYILGESFQNIPKKAYIYDRTKKRYYAAGYVYHACMIEKRKLLMLYLFSHFKAVSSSKIFMAEIKTLLSTRRDDGFFEFDKSIIQEVKDSYYMYSGSHMGMGEIRTNKNWISIESTYWMLEILLNLEKNGIIID